MDDGTSDLLPDHLTRITSIERPSLLYIQPLLPFSPFKFGDSPRNIIQLIHHSWRSIKTSTLLRLFLPPYMSSLRQDHEDPHQLIMVSSISFNPPLYLQAYKQSQTSRMALYNGTSTRLRHGKINPHIYL